MNNYLDIILAPVITEKSANMEAEGKYAPEKPVAASPGLFLNLTFTK